MFEDFLLKTCDPSASKFCLKTNFVKKWDTCANMFWGKKDMSNHALRFSFK